jgi:tetratricopeptide (TPR) repeat protein
LDPEIADAHRIVARAQIAMGFLGIIQWRQALRQARAEITTGLALAPDDPRLLHTLGTLQHYFELDYLAAEASYRASLDADPLHPDAYRNYYQLGFLKTQRGDLDGAIAELRRALRVNDSDGDVYVLYSFLLLWIGQHRDALQAADSGLELIRGGFNIPLLHQLKAMALAALGENEQAKADLDETLAKAPELRSRLILQLKTVGRLDEARAVLKELEGTESPPVVPMIYAYTAFDDERVFDWLHKAIDERAIEIIVGLRMNPAFARLRHDGRWDDVMAHLEAEEAKGAVGNN